MALTYIAFIECVLRPNGHWVRKLGQPDFSANLGDSYTPRGKDAEMALVDIKQNRRYFAFHNHHAWVRIVNNTVIFDNDDAEEFSVDESKQFPKKPTIDN